MARITWQKLDTGRSQIAIVRDPENLVDFRNLHRLHTNEYQKSEIQRQVINKPLNDVLHRISFEHVRFFLFLSLTFPAKR